MSRISHSVINCSEAIVLIKDLVREGLRPENTEDEQHLELFMPLLPAHLGEFQVIPRPAEKHCPCSELYYYHPHLIQLSATFLHSIFERGPNKLGYVHTNMF